MTKALSNLRAFQQRPLDFLSQMEAEFGSVVRFHTGLLPVCLVTSPSGVNRVLQSNHRNYSKQTFTYAMARALSGENLLTSEGTEWVHRRRTVQPLFHRTVLDGFGQVMIEAAQTWVEKWLSRGQPIDLVEEMMGLTLEVAGRTLFSVDLSTATAEVRAALNASAEAFMGQFQSPRAMLWTLVGFPSPRSQALRQANDYLDGLLYTLMAERRDCEEMPVDMLSLLLQTVDEESGKPLTDREIRDEIGVFLTAGHETTALGLTWTWLSLAQNSKAESRLHTELEQVLGGRTPVVSDLPRLPYTQAVFEESLRLYPPVWGFSRRAVDDDAIDGYRIPAGARIMLSPYVTQRSRRYWSEPTHFRPERFLSDGEHPPQIDGYFPFGLGPRRCIGQRFALMEGVLVLATIAQRVRLSRADESPVEPSALATLRPSPSPYLVPLNRAM